jgi:Ca2+-binding RTX toxin-like protein
MPAVLALTFVAAAAHAQSTILSKEEAAEVCGPKRSNETCGPGKGRTTPGGGEKVSHKGWPRVTGILWQVRHNRGSSMTGSLLDDELLGHHGSDDIDGGEGNDIIWGDWDPRNNPASQRDTLVGGPGDDFIYPSHGATRVDAGDGDDYIWAFYGRGTIDCGPGNDRVRVRTNKAFKVSRNCETVNHFCTFGSDGKGGCLKPGEAREAKAKKKK